MAVLVKSLTLYDSQGKNPVVITDDERITLKISKGMKGSTMDVTLKNAYGEHVSNGKFKYGSDYIFKLYAKWVDDASYTLAEADLLMAANVIDVNAVGEEKSIAWNFNCMDRTFIILNRLWNKTYPTTLSLNAPNLIKSVVNSALAEGTGTLITDLKADLAEGSFSGGVFTRSGGGYIQNVRPDNSDFPVISFAKTFKPIYEWLDDLSQTNITNTAAELAETGTPACARPYFTYIDETNNLHWEYPGTNPENVATYMTWGTTSIINPDTKAHYITSFNMKKSVFDIINFVIYNSGKDLFGSGILYYYYNAYTKSSKLKPVYRVWTEIADQVIGYEILTANPTKYAQDDTNGTLKWHDKRYTADYSGGGFIPHWSTSLVTSDTELNLSLRNYCIDAGKNRAQRLTVITSNPRWKGTITIRGEKVVLGELICFNSSDHGIQNAYVRVQEVQHNFSGSGWETTLNVEEDGLEINNG